MIKYFFLILIFFNFLQSEDFFETRQKTLQDIKNIVQYEESLARAYEQYIVDNYKLPSSISDITSLIGGNISSFVTTVGSNVNTTVLTSGLPKINYALGSNLITDTSIKSLYESNTFRKKTYIRDSAVYFMLEDAFAKHLFDLIKQSDAIVDCPPIINTAINCKENNHIFVGVSNSAKTTFLMNYYIEKFKTGPIIITNDTSKYTNSVFSSISKGTLLYDINGIKYVKTTTSIEALK